MAIRFRCEHCSGLMSISNRKAGMVVVCPTCGRETLVPLEDVFEAAAPVLSPPIPQEHNVVDSPTKPEPSPVVSEEPIYKAPVEAVGQDADDEDDAPALTLRRRSRIDDEMDLTPMVDVTFQLLIFFMVTASFALQKSIEAPTPDPDKKGATQQLQTLDDLEGTSIRVQIDAANVISIDDEPVADATRVPEVLKDKMRKELKTEVLITAHAQALHRSVIAVIDAANSVGMQKIRLVSRTGKSE